MDKSAEHDVWHGGKLALETPTWAYHCGSTQPPTSDDEPDATTEPETKAEDKAEKPAESGGGSLFDLGGDEPEDKTDLDAIVTHVSTVQPRLLIIDSVQTIAAAEVDGVPGGVTQVREVAAN
mgnify:CR=1 FL=1